MNDSDRPAFEKAMEWYLSRHGRLGQLFDLCPLFWGILNHIDWIHVRQAFIDTKFVDEYLTPPQVKAIAESVADTSQGETRLKNATPESTLADSQTPREKMNADVNQNENLTTGNVARLTAKTAFEELARRWEKEIEDQRYATAEEKMNAHRQRMVDFWNLFGLIDKSMDNK